MIYTIHMNNTDVAPVDDGVEDGRFDSVVAIPESTAKWAIVFPPLWLAWHKLWWPLVVYLLIGLLASAAFVAFQSLAILLLAGLPGMYLFLEGHQLRRYGLETRGYKLIDVVEASDETAAINRFVANWEEPARAPRKPIPTLMKRPTPAPSFGLFSGNEG